MAATEPTTATAPTAVRVEQHSPEELSWEAPGPGSWELDKGHVPRPLTTFTVQVASEPFRAGFADTFRRYGVPVRELREGYVNGFSYGQIVPIDGSEFAARAATAEEALATRLWRADLERWDIEVKPATIRRHAELIAVDVDAVPIPELIDHLRDCAEHVTAMVLQHHVFNGAAMLPLGDLLVSVEAWTGGAVTAAEVLALFAGASPISRGDCPELRAVASAIASDDRAASTLAATESDPAELLEALCSPERVDEGTARAVGEWLALVGQRVLDGFDVSCPRAIEVPAVLASCLRNADAVTQAPPEPDVAAVRDRIPEEHREGFDAAYAEARLTYRLRDERGIYSDATANGIMRRAMLAVGGRLAADGRLSSPELAVEAGVDELVALLDADPSAPSVDELEARARFRASHTADDAPQHLGEPPTEPPSLDLLPPSMGRMTRALRTLSGNLGAQEATSGGPADSLTGVPASPGRHEGTARIVHSVDDLLRVREGDVLVAITTTEAFNLAMSFAAAVVTDQGGLLGHAAITAREYGIPAVVGTHRATSAIADGTRVVVDGTTGVVSW